MWRWLNQWFLIYGALVHSIVYRLMWHWPQQWSIFIRLYFCSFIIYVLFLSFQVILLSNSWKGFQQFSSINFYEVLEVMLKSRADTTTKAYVRVIRKFLEWSKSRHFNMQLPFPLSVVSLYLFEVQQSCTSSSSVILAHAALKWLHSFVPSLVVILWIVNFAGILSNLLNARNHS